MSKKTQHRDQGKQPKNDLLDEESEPFLRMLAKRIRNLNKKLTEITDLESKGNLKPEQYEKINRKQQVVEEIQKLEENYQLFKTNYQENAEYYRNQQLAELENLARAVVVFQGFGHFEQHERIA
jgi:hypothetical protein